MRWVIAPSRPAQLLHVALITTGPALGALGAVGWVATHAVAPSTWGVAAALFVISVVGIEVGYHRLFSHGAFKAVPWLARALQRSGAIAAQGPALYWAALHRKHHAHSDTDEDPHTPHGVHGSFVRAHVGWMFEPPPEDLFERIPDLLADRRFVRADRWYAAWAVAGLALPAGVGWLSGGGAEGAVEGLLIGGLLRVFVVQHGIWSINSVCHLWGRRPFNSRDRSTNVPWLTWLTLGGSLHNTHHAFPFTARNDLLPQSPDPGAWVISAFERLGWVTEVKMPSADVVARHRA